VKFNKALLKSNFQNHLVNKERHEKFNDDFFNEIILKNYCEMKKVSELDKKGFEISNFILSIQKDISTYDDNFQ